MNTSLMMRIGVILITGAFGIAGCATSPPNKQAEAATELTDTKQELIATSAGINQALESMNTLMRSPPDEIRSAYAVFAKDVDAVHKQGAVLQKNISEIRESTREWMTDWKMSKGTIENTELRQLSEKRQAQVQASLAQIERSFRQARSGFGSFLNDLDDVRAALANDQTPVGVATISRTQTVARANERGRATARNLENAANQFDKITTSMPKPAGK